MTYSQIKQNLGDDAMANYGVDDMIDSAIHAAKGLCARQHETWGPNEGCKEFMSGPEIHRCPEKAVQVAVFQSYGDAGIEFLTEQLCTEHALEALRETEFDQLVTPGDISCVGFLDMTDDKAHR